MPTCVIYGGKIMWIFDFNKLDKTFLCILPALCVSPAASAERVGNADVEIRHDSNINNAQSNNDIASDSASSVSVSETGVFFPEEDIILSLAGEAAGMIFDRYTGLNNLSLGATLALRKKWALGPYAPWSSLSLSSQHLNFADDIRNGWNDRLTIGGGQRISERWNVRAEGVVDRRTADALQSVRPGISGDVFSQSSRAMTLNAEYAWRDGAFLSFGSLLRRGDVVASTRGSKHIFLASEAIAADPVFGQGFYAYRMAGTTYGLNADMNIAVTSHSLLRASIARQVTDAAGGNDYAKNVTMLSWDYDF